MTNHCSEFESQLSLVGAKTKIHVRQVSFHGMKMLYYISENFLIGHFSIIMIELLDLAVKEKTACKLGPSE